MTEEEIIAMPKDSTTFYFPLWDSTKGFKIYHAEWEDTFLKKYFSEELFDLHEPVLSNYKGQSEIYRFTWLRSFKNPVSFRLQKTGNAIYLTTKICDGVGFRHGKIILEKKAIISALQLSTFKSFLNKIDYWNLAQEATGASWTDGSSWILEGVSDNKYRWVIRDDPDFEDRYPDFATACAYLRIISRIKFDEE